MSNNELEKTEEIDIGQLMNQLIGPNEREEAERLNRKRVVAILRENDIKYLRDSDGDIAIFAHDSKHDFTVRIMIMFSGDIITSRGIPDIKFNDFQLSEALEFCNEWNGCHHWPTACVSEESQTMFCNVSFDAEYVKGKVALSDVVRFQMIGSTMHFCEALTQKW